MNMYEWYGLPRKAIPGVMLGMEIPGEHSYATPEAALNDQMEIAVAFSKDRLKSADIPRLVVIPDQKVADVLGWLHTFSNETFPLSQYCRVLSRTDWGKASSQNESEWNLPRRHRWASLIAGEMLGQAEATGPVSSAPLGWAHGCLSYAVARTVQVYGHSSFQLLSTIAERLGMCEADGGFQGKRLSGITLSSIWRHAESDSHFEESPAEIAHTIVSAVSPRLGNLLRSNQGLSSSSAERRVQGFDDAVDEALRGKDTFSQDPKAMGALLAGAAFLVGTGTSHINLLEPYARDFPEAYPWLGLMAGIAGPKSWDSDWMRLVKGVERLLSVNHTLTDAPQEDLSWVEYRWLSTLSKGNDTYTGLPRQNARSLNLELFPGIACQFRLRASAAGRGQSGEVGRRLPTAATEAHISVEKLTKARLLLREAESLLSPEKTSHGQGALFEQREQAPATTSKRKSYVKKAGMK